jgi:hypothetical protein
VTSPDTRVLRTSQRNAVYTAIVDFGMTPADFSLGETEWSSARISRLTHKISGYYFDFYPAGSGQWVFKYSPGDFESEGRSDRQVVWSDIERALRGWLVFLKEEVLAPDLWSGDILAGVAVDPGNELHNEPLNEVEVRIIGQRVAAVRAFVLECGVNGEQLAEVDQKLDYLASAATRLGRFDWRNLAVGIVVDIAIAAAFNPQQAQNMLNLLIGVAQRLVG